MKEEKDQKKPRKLTRKQIGFIDDYVATGNGTQAALKNYDVKNEHVARSIASENLTKPDVAVAIQIKQESLRSALAKQGVTPEKIARKVDELLESDDGNIVDKGLKHATNIYGTEDLQEKPKQGNTYNFIFSEDVQSKVREIDSHIKKLLTKDDVQEN